jgi:hypothetical protein
VLIKKVVHNNILLQLSQNMYDTFKEGVEEAMKDAALSQIRTKAARRDHDAYVEVKCSNHIRICNPDR